MEAAELKKIKSDISRRKTNYKNRGYEIISGQNALDTLNQSETHSLLGVDTNYWSSLEYIETNNIFSEKISFYLHRFLSNGKFCKKLCTSNDKSFTDFISEKHWAVRKNEDMIF